MDVDVGSAPNF